MNPSNLGGTITIDSHTKQIKLLNEYILSLQKKLGEKKEEYANKLNVTEDLRKMNEENIRLRN